MKRNQHKIWFWVLQFFGWGLIAVINSIGKIVSTKELSKTYIILEGIGFILAGIVSSLWVRQYLKRKLSFDKFQKKEILTVSYSLIIGSFLLFILIYVFSSIFYYSIYNNWVDITFESFFSTLINSILFILFWITLYLSIKITRQLRKSKLEKLSLEASLKESQLNTLIGQINPHFMFNSLNNIRGLMLEDVDKSREMITRLSDMLRYSLTKNNTSKISISDELEMVDNYVELSKIQLEDRLSFKKDIDKSILDIQIPPMIIQMLIENAIKHGISNLKNGGTVSLNIQIIDSFLTIQVINTGNLHIKSTSTKVGLENIKKRLFLLFGNRANFSLNEKDNHVIATIKIPQQNE